MRTGRPIPPLSLSDDERETLKQWTRRPKTSQALAQRARIILACAAGESNTTVSERLRVTKQTIGKWRTRFVNKGLDGLLDEPRPGTPRRLSDAEVERVLTMTLEATPKNATHWSNRSLAAACGLSRSSVQRIWRAFALAPHRSESFKLSRDPLFIDKVRDIVGFTWILRIRRWCCALTRSLRFKRWIVRSQFCLCDQDKQNAGLMITSATVPLRCSPPWTLRLARSSVSFIVGTARLSFASSSIRSMQRCRQDLTSI